MPGNRISTASAAPVGTNICRTSTFTFSSTEEMKLWAEGKSKAYIYTRYGNPTLTVAQEKIAALEGAEAAVVTASGMAAISCALLGTLKAGDELISTAQLYGGSYRLMRDIFPDMGITSSPRGNRPGRDGRKIIFQNQSAVCRDAHESHAASRGPAQSGGLREKSTNSFPLSITLLPRPYFRIPFPWATTWWCTAPPKRSPAIPTSSPVQWPAARSGWSACSTW